jgi:hypothetical protein
VLIPSSVDPRAVVRLERLGQLKNQVALSGIEPATFRLVYSVSTNCPITYANYIVEQIRNFNYVCKFESNGNTDA